MKIMYITHAAILSVAVMAVLGTGCASVAVSNNTIEQNTAHALGLEKDTFTISDRVDDGVKSSYFVKTNGGKRYSCYVTGTLSVAGRVVSDAMCNEVSNEGSKPAKQTPGTAAPCNALLKAAGKC